MNLLANISGQSESFISFMVKQLASIDLNWIGDIIKFLVEGVGITAVGVILFTLILKTIVLPLDIFSKVKTKKQSLIMKSMRPQMEKLQKQYANDKNMYNQKVMELYKKNGYSMLGVCLPTLVSLIIFMVVFSQFSTYSQYANLELYRGMVSAYNDVAAEYVCEDIDAAYDKEGNYGFLIEEKDSDGETVYRVDFDRFQSYYTDNKAAEDPSYEELTADVQTENDMFLIVKDYMAEFARDAAADY